MPELPAVEPELTTSPAPKPKTSPLILIILLIFCLFAIGSSVFLYWQNHQLQQQLVLLTASQTTKPVLTNPNPDRAASWQTYTNPTYKYSFSYPNTWKLITDARSEAREVTIQSSLGELIHTTIFSKPSTTPVDNQNGGLNKTFIFGNNSLLVTYVACDGPGCGNGKKDINTFTQILSTFKFTDQEGTNSNNTSNWQTYNSSNQFTLKYPTTLTLTKLAKDANQYEIEKNQLGESITLTVIKNNPEFSDAQAYLNYQTTAAKQSTNGPTSTVSSSSNSIGSLKVLKINYGGVDVRTEYVFDHNGQLYILSVNEMALSEVQSSETNSLATQILSTFKFNTQ